MKPKLFQFVALVALAVAAKSSHAQTPADAANTLKQNKPQLKEPFSTKLIQFMLVPEAITIEKEGEFSSWFAKTFEAALGKEAPPPIRQGWQFRYSHIRLYGDRLEIDAPIPPARGGRMMKLCRMVFPFRQPGMKGNIVDATQPGSLVTSGISECELDKTVPDAFSLTNRSEQIEKREFDVAATLVGVKKPIHNAPNWFGQIAIASQAAFDYGMIAPLRLAKPGEDPVVMTDEPVAFSNIIKPAPRISHFLYHDGSVLSSINFSLEDDAEPNSHILSCIVRTKDDNTFFEGNPFVMQWCRMQVARALPEGNRRVSAYRLKYPPNRPR